MIATTAGALPGCARSCGAPPRRRSTAGRRWTRAHAGRGELFVAIRGGHGHTAPTRGRGAARRCWSTTRRGCGRDAGSCCRARPDRGAADHRRREPGGVGRDRGRRHRLRPARPRPRTCWRALVGAERRTVAAAASHNTEIGVPLHAVPDRAPTPTSRCARWPCAAPARSPSCARSPARHRRDHERRRRRTSSSSARARRSPRPRPSCSPRVRRWPWCRDGEPLLEPHLPRPGSMLVTFGEEAGADVRTRRPQPAGRPACGRARRRRPDDRASTANLRGAQGLQRRRRAWPSAGRSGSPLATRARGAPARSSSQRWRGRDQAAAAAAAWS